MIYVIDLDNTITFTDNANYEDAKPNWDVIGYVNDLYLANHTIIIYTARGTTSGINWRRVTEKQLAEWKVLYHELKIGKLFYDVWIDDKSINVTDLNL